MRNLVKTATLVSALALLAAPAAGAAAASSPVAGTAAAAPPVAGRAAAPSTPSAASPSTVTAAVPAPPTTATAAARSPVSAAAPAVISSRIIGYSMRGKPIRAYELGDRNAAKTVVALGAMHGDEKGGTVILSELRSGPPIAGVHLWIIPRHNVDGYLLNQRHNARKVDLNRNYPTNWKPLTGWSYSGPAPASERETRVLMRFLNRVDPEYVVSFHSPLYGVDVYGSKDRPFAQRLADYLRLPVKEFSCSGTCHGTLTQWFNATHLGVCVTVELARSPTWYYLHELAPKRLVRAVGGRFVQ